MSRNARAGSIEQLLERWFAANAPEWSDEVAKTTRSNLDRHVIPRIGSEPQTRLDQSFIDEFEAGLRAPGGPELAESTARRIARLVERAREEHRSERSDTNTERTGTGSAADASTTNREQTMSDQESTPPPDAESGGTAPPSLEVVAAEALAEYLDEVATSTAEAQRRVADVARECAESAARTTDDLQQRLSSAADTYMEALAALGADDETAATVRDEHPAFVAALNDVVAPADQSKALAALYSQYLTAATTAAAGPNVMADLYAAAETFQAGVNRLSNPGANWTAAADAGRRYTKSPSSCSSLPRWRS